MLTSGAPNEPPCSTPTPTREICLHADPDALVDPICYNYTLTPTATYTPTPTPTGWTCTSSVDTDSDTCQGSTWTPSPTPNPTVTPTSVAEFCTQSRMVVIEYLEQYYNFIIADSPQNWDDSEIQETCWGVVSTGLALQSFAASQGKSYLSPAHAFTSILLFDSTDTITLQVDAGSNCLTSKPAQNEPSMATISCGSTIPLTRYVVVHELGHVFAHRTTEIVSGTIAYPCAGSSLNDCMRQPVNGNSLGMRDSFVFGARTQYFTQAEVQTLLTWLGITGLTADDPVFTYQQYFLPEDQTFYLESPSDWLRGTRGWGSGAPQPGPCQNAASSTFAPTSFQQNPCVAYRWIHIAQNPPADVSGPAFDNGLGVDELEEASADMFLNWVFRTLYSDTGFANVDWGTGSSATPDNVIVTELSTQFPGAVPLNRQGPGDDRFYWMNYRMAQFFNYYGF